jgi:hypothetical protein
LAAPAVSGGRSRSQRLLLIHRKPIMKRVTLRKLGLAIYQLKFKLVPVTTHIVAEGELRAESSEHSESNKDQVRTTIICK